MKEITKDKCKPASITYGTTAQPAAKDTDTDTDVLSPTRMKLWSRLWYTVSHVGAIRSGAEDKAGVTRLPLA